MRLSGYLSLLIVAGSLLQAASIRSQVSLLEASENIRLGSQEVVKNYLFLYHNPGKTYVRELVKQGLDDLDAQFRLIARSTKDEDSKDILTFLDYSKGKMLEVLKDPFEKENPALMLDYSEVLLEGAETISQNLKYTPSKEEAMLIKMKDMAYLIERMTKYYMAMMIEPDNSVYNEMLSEAMTQMESDIDSAGEEYQYSGDRLKDLEMLKANWLVLKSFLENKMGNNMPNIILLVSSEVKKSVHVLETFHSKNQ